MQGHAKGVCCTLSSGRARRERRVQVRWHVAALVASLALSGQAAHAEPPPCGQTDQTWINVKFLGRGWTKKLSDAVLAELKTDLAGNGIAACAEVPSAILPP